MSMFCYQCQETAKKRFLSLMTLINCLLPLILLGMNKKAVIVLLALLYLGISQYPSRPTLPGFLSPNVAKFLVEEFGIAGIGDVEEDIWHNKREKNNRGLFLLTGPLM